MLGEHSSLMCKTVEKYHWKWHEIVEIHAQLLDSKLKQQKHYAPESVQDIACESHLGGPIKPLCNIEYKT